MTRIFGAPAMLARIIRIVAPLGLATVFMTGCASEPITSVAQYRAMPVTRPDIVYVRGFTVDPALVHPDSGRLASRRAAALGELGPDRLAALGQQVKEAVALRLVKRLNAMGLPAVRSNLPAPGDRNVLIVEGQFALIDAGNRLRRTVIGLGAGASQLAASVSLSYQTPGQLPVLIQSYVAAVDSGHKPGMAETMGAGAAIGGIAQSAAIGGALHAHDESVNAKPVNDAERMADAIAKQLQQIGAAQGWLPQTTTR